MSKSINITENDVVRLVTESVKKLMKEDEVFNVWMPITRPTSPLEQFAMRDGWEKMEREDDEPLYRDPDYNEYVIDDYGRKFIPVDDYSEIAETKQLRNFIRKMVNEELDNLYGVGGSVAISNAQQPAGGVPTVDEKFDSASGIRKQIRQ